MLIAPLDEISDMTNIPSVPAYELRVGVTGHRDLPDHFGVERAVVFAPGLAPAHATTRNDPSVSDKQLNQLRRAVLVARVGRHRLARQDRRSSNSSKRQRK